ncbi:hypothetical protein DC498_22940 [Terrimonas sp.]|nr:hypothetical protein DC498_22940 [Terrimonas sp.]
MYVTINKEDDIKDMLGRNKICVCSIGDEEKISANRFEQASKFSMSGLISTETILKMCIKFI